MTVERKHRPDVETTTRCGVCGQEYDLGEPTWAGDNFYWWPDGEAKYRQHSKSHSPEGKSLRVGKCNAVCVWYCSVCGKQSRYLISGAKHAGPAVRLIDPRYGLATCDGSTYPKHKRAFGRMDGARGPVIFYHDGAPNPPVVEQTDPTIIEIEKKHEESLRKRSRRKNPKKGSRKDSAGTERAAAESGPVVTRRREV